MSTAQHLFNAANFILCLFIVFIGVCRLNAMGEHVYRRVVVEYVSLVTGAVACAVQPWWGELPQWGTVGFVLAILTGLICSSSAWDGDEPPETATEPAPLGKQ